MKNYTAQEWDSAFNGRLPEKIATLAASSKQLINSFHERMKDRRFLVENNDLVKGFLVVILAAQKEKLAHIANEHQKLVQTAQKDANRLFGPVIQRAMNAAYQGCVDLRGERCECLEAYRQEANRAQPRRTRILHSHERPHEGACRVPEVYHVQDRRRRCGESHQHNA